MKFGLEALETSSAPEHKGRQRCQGGDNSAHLDLPSH
jgi:hypothetical protein